MSAIADLVFMTCGGGPWISLCRSPKLCNGGGAAGLLACSRGAAALDLRQNLVDHGVLGHGLAEGGIQALEQLRDRLAVATHERDAHFLALSGKRSAADRRDLPEGDLTARVVKEGLQVAERCGVTLGLEHRRIRYAARASVTWLG